MISLIHQQRQEFYEVYIGNLPHNISKEELSHEFHEYNIRTLEIKKDDNSSALLTFFDYSEAFHFLKDFNCKEINGTRIRATWRIQKKHIAELERINVLTINNISHEVNESKLYSLFIPYGLIFSLKIHRSPKRSDKLLNGFVVYYDKKSCYEAQSNVNQTFLGTEKLQVSLSLELQLAKRMEENESELLTTKNGDTTNYCEDSLRSKSSNSDEIVKKSKKLKKNSEPFNMNFQLN